MNEAPRARHIEVDPVYAEQDGVKHEFTGLLYVPAPGETDRLQVERDTAPPTLNPVCLATPLVEKPFRTGWTSRRVKMTAREMIRLTATRR